MTTINELTEAQFKTLLDEYFAPAEKRTQMTEAEIMDLAKRLNNEINVPIINETHEQKILIKIVIKVDRFLYDNLPNEFYDLIRSLDKGIDDKEAKRLIKRLAKLANRKLDIPYLPETVEYFAIRFIIGLIINAARKHWDLNMASNNTAKLNIPKFKNANAKQLERIII